MRYALHRQFRCFQIAEPRDCGLLAAQPHPNPVLLGLLLDLFLDGRSALTSATSALEHDRCTKSNQKGLLERGWTRSLDLKRTEWTVSSSFPKLLSGGGEIYEPEIGYLHGPTSN